MTYRGRLKYDNRPYTTMTRYSASRGIRYSAPPGPDGNRTEATDANESADESVEEGAETDEPSVDAEHTSADATADD